MLPHAASWFDAWTAAASGPDGFWRRSRPRDHLATAAAAGPELVQAVRALVGSYPDVGVVVDVGAGDAALLNGLAATRPAYELVGVDLRPRPPDLAADVGWVTDCWDVRTDRWTSGAVPELLAHLDGPAALLATEWLDDLPCRVAVRGPDGHRELAADGSVGPVLSPEDQSWVDRWWPHGGRAEVGRSRDDAWAALVAALAPHGGVALAVDYGHLLAARPADGSLAGFRTGRPVAAVPDRRANLTAAVAVDSLAEAGERAGASTRWCRQQAEVLDALLVAEADDDPLQELARRSRRAALGRPRDWGSHWWLLQEIPPEGL